MSRHRVYKDIELLYIAKHCNNFEELKAAAAALTWLTVQGWFVNLKLFEVFAHKRIREIAAQS